LNNWIWIPSWKHKDKKKPRLVYFRRVFVLNEKPVSAEIKISADTRYKLYVNGKLVEVGPSKGDREVWYKDILDIAPFLHVGSNVIAVIVLRYPVERKLGNHGMFRTEIPGLFLEGIIRDSLGSVIDISADRYYRCRINRDIKFPPEEKRFAPLLIHEISEGDPELHGWMDPSYDDSAWEQALPYETGFIDEAVSPGNLNNRTIPYMYRKKKSFIGLLENESDLEEAVWKDLFDGKNEVMIPANSRIRIVADAGEEMTGYLHFAFSGGTGAEIQILESEAYEQSEKSLTSKMPIKKDRLDVRGGHLSGYTDIYTVGGFGDKSNPELYEPFFFRTFRMIEMVINTSEEPLVLHTFNYDETGYPLEVKTSVDTSDNSFDPIWDISERTLRRCMHETYEDCPFYEQLQYVMDTRSQILYTYTVSADDRLARKAIDDFARSQRSNGLLNSCYPNMNPNVIPGFSIYYILMLHDHMMYFGDKKLIRRYISVVDKILNYFDRHLDENGLVEKIGGVLDKARYWSFIDWATEWNLTQGMPPAGLKGPITMESLLYMLGLQKAAELVRFLGRNDTADEYETRAELVKKAVINHCKRSDGMITDGPGCEDVSQHGQVFGVLTGVLDTKEGKKNLLRTIEEPGFAQCTVAMRFYLFRALEETGLYEYTNRYWDTWRTMVKNNCTTCIESEDYSRSECHAWGALALYEIPSVILGVRPAEPGCKKIYVRPHAEYLQYASGTVHLLVGDIKVSWKRVGDNLNLKVEAPEGITVV
jgi:hypothetical protein